MEQVKKQIKIFVGCFVRAETLTWTSPGERTARHASLNGHYGNRINIEVTYNRENITYQT